LQGSNPPQLKIELCNRLLVFGLPLILLGQIGFFVRSFGRKIQRRLMKCPLNWLKQIYLPAILHSSIAIGFLVLLPIGTKVPLSIMLLAQPDITITAIGCSAVAVCSLLQTMAIALSVKR
jgi:hypothetical protein